MTRTFCDKCGKNLQRENRRVVKFTIPFFNQKIKYDLCESCFNKVVNFIVTQEETPSK